MGWQLPSLAALRTFEAAARHLSFTRAASELSLTQSAVSRHIRAMEEYLGVKLFQRVKQRLLLTEAGRTYAEDVRAALAQMQAATMNLIATQGKGGILNLATPPAFGTKWLMPRLHRFTSANPEILINLVTRARPFDLASESIDVAIHYGNNDWPGVLSDRLIGGEMVIVCAPAYLDRSERLLAPGDVAEHTLLQWSVQPNMWRDWMDARGVAGSNAWQGPRFEHLYMVMQAAIGQLGIALLPRVLVAEDIDSGRLVVPFEDAYTSSEAYCLVYRPERSADQKVQLFRQWLREEARRSPG